MRTQPLGVNSISFSKEIQDKLEFTLYQILLISEQLLEQL